MFCQTDAPKVNDFVFMQWSIYLFIFRFILHMEN